MKTFVTMIAILGAASIAQGAVISASGELTKSSYLATDSTGKTFYYDIYELSNPTGAAISVGLILDADTDMAPWLNYWTNSPLPALNWESPLDIYSSALGDAFDYTPGTSVSVPAFSLPANTSYQIGVATSLYNEDGALLDTYTLTADSVSASSLELNAIPEPSSAILLGLAFAARRRRV